MNKRCLYGACSLTCIQKTDMKKTILVALGVMVCLVGLVNGDKAKHDACSDQCYDTHEKLMKDTAGHMKGLSEYAEIDFGVFFDEHLSSVLDMTRTEFINASVEMVTGMDTFTSTEEDFDKASTEARVIEGLKTWKACLTECMKK